MRIGVVGRLRRDDLARQHALRQIVDALEMTARPRRDQTRPEHPLERDFRLAARPPSSAALLGMGGLDLRRTQRTARFDLAEHVVRERTALLREARDVTPHLL